MTTVLAGSATANGATIITVPAGQTWRGHVTLSAGLSAAIGAGALSAAPSVTVQGTGAVPAAGTVLTQLTLTTPAVGALALLGIGLTDSREVSKLKVTAPAGNAVTLQLNTGSATGAAATAFGEYGNARPTGVVTVFNAVAAAGASSSIPMPDPVGRITGQVETTSNGWEFNLQGSFDGTNWFNTGGYGTTVPGVYTFTVTPGSPYFLIRGNLAQLDDGVLTAKVVFTE